jgi:hypothetical protein
MSTADPSAIFRWTPWIFAGRLALLVAGAVCLRRSLKEGVADG